MTDLGMRLKGWVTMDGPKTLKTLASTMAARVLFGPELCRSRDLVSFIMTFTTNLFLVVYSMRLIPWVLSPLTWFFVRCNPAYYFAQTVADRIRRIIEPAVERHRTSDDKTVEQGGPPSALMWMSLNGKTNQEIDADALSRRLVMLTIAASFTVSDSLTFLFYDLCRYPSFTEDLRQEAEQCWRESGRWDRTTLGKMRKIESFMCESQRMHPGLLRECPTCKAPRIDLCSDPRPDPVLMLLSYIPPPGDETHHIVRRSTSSARHRDRNVERKHFERPLSDARAGVF